jgi:quercetin dioxygenase-like cupin family protein
MRRVLFLGALACLALLTAQAQDPVNVAGDVYKVIVENDRVRVLDVTIPAGTKTAMHSHPDSAAVVLEPGTIKWTRANGRSEQSGPGFTRGSILYMAGETHVAENMGTTSAHFILVEFKKPAPILWRNPSLPAPYNHVAENPHAAVFEAIVAPGGTVPKHTHGDRVVVSLTDGTAEVTDEGGKKQTVTFKKDTATFAGLVTHSEANTGQTPLHWIVLELK